MLSKGWSSRIIWSRNILLFVIITRLGNVKCQCEVGWCESCQADPKICTKCIAPYYGLREDGSACERCRSGCLLCTRLSVCDVCVDPTSDGPVFDASGTCRPCAPDCSFCGLSGHGKCDLCQPGFRLTAGQTCQGSAVQTTTQTTTTTTKTASITTTTTTIPTPTTTQPITCSATQFQCRDGTCVNVEAICDGRRDCFDGSDEINNCGTWTTPSIVTQCPETTHMMCNNTHRCVRLSWRCDGYNDCGDDSDERNCVCNRTNQFECTSPQRCISLSRQCDGITDCVDRSDEINCTCEPLTQFQCSTTGPRCIPLYQTCDLQVDCLDGSDELNCSCTPAENRFRCENGKCVRKSVTCDFYNDCMDGSDERNCAYPVCNPATQFTCSSGQCIPLSARCDSFNNCIDKSDELFCNCSSSEHFQCVNGQCVSSSVRCNKVRDCDDGTDERECNAGCSSNQLMCESGWCLYTSSQCIKACPNLLCDGFIDCPDGSDERNCSDDTILSTPPASTSVVTTPTTTRAHSEYSRTPNHCKYNEFQCDNGHCVAAYYVCDRGDDCGDSSDENSCSEHSYKPLSNHFVLATDSQTPGLYQMSMINGEVRQLLEKKPRNPVAVAYDSTNRAIYWTDSVQRSINRFSLITRRNLAIFTITASSSTLEGLTIGDEGRLLFYTNFADGAVGQIGQISINGSVRQHSIIYSQAGVIPKAIVFHSLTRALYWTDSGASPGIYRRMLDTTSATVIVSDRLLQPNALSIDFEEGKMYWADIGTHTLEVSGLDGSHRAVISQGSVEQYSSLALSATDIYIADWTAPSYIKIISRSTYAGRFYAQQKFGRINGLAAYSVKTDSAGCTIEWETHERRTIIGGGQSYGGNRSTAVECQGFCVALVQCVAISYSMHDGCSVYTNPAAAIDQMTDAQDDSAVYVITRRCPTPLATDGGCEGLGAFQCDNGWCLSVKHDCISTWCNKVSLECDGFADCPDGSDEAYCTNVTSGQCAPGEFSCTNGNCVSYSRLCSSQNSCGDNSQLEQCSGVCSELEMRCNNSGRCLAVSRRCDGSNDCGDFSDELNCACNETTQFHCVTAGRCIPLGWRCDGSNDCGDDSDEFNCSPVKRCNSSAEHECSSSGRCIPLSWKCDGFIDCGDNSDETNCSCSANQFRCSNGQCVPLFYRCNGGMCVDGSDLLDCRACEVGEYRCDQTACRSLSSWCDGVVDCQDSSDEKDCSSTTRCPVGYGSCSFNARDCIHQSLSCNGVADCTNATDEINCPCSTVTQFRCASGICVNGTAWCDGVVNCGDGSDEPPECQIRCNPHQMLTCKNGRCVRVEDKCDGVNNCGDYSDEINCEACTSSFNSFTCAMGVCLPASVFCNKSRECPDGSDEPAHCENLCSGSSFTCDNGRCIGKAYRCNGFNNCGDYSDEANCSCSAGQVKCDMGLCLSSSFWCDSYQDCPDGSDEKPGCTSVCPVNSRKCSLTGECISAFQICDRIRDCPDGSDEESCDCIAGEYRCETAGCISTAWLCDGTADCPLRDDEDPTRCNKCQPSQFVCTSDYQCTNSQHRCDGALDCNDKSDEASCISLGQAGATVAEHSTRLLTAIYHGEHGYLICSHSWSDVLSNSVCLSMGYGNALAWSSNPKPADASRILAVHDSADVSTSGNFIQTLSRDSCDTGSVVGINCSQPECGVRKVHSDSIGSYIINGHIAEEGAWPWQAAVFYNGEMKCGGAVISKRWILTAAHCGYIFRSAHLIKVRVGSVFRTSDDGNAELFDVDLVTLHPAYSHGNVTHPGDVALLRLTTPIQYTDYIQPICLPTPDTTALQYSKLCVIAGFGATRYVNGRNSEFLLQGKVNVMSESTCRTVYAELGGTLSLTQEFQKYFICTGSQLNIHDISACTGDSGGPLVCVDQRNIWTVHGLISWGLRCDLTIYSRASYYIDWIKDTINAN